MGLFDDSATEVESQEVEAVENEVDGSNEDLESEDLESEESANDDTEDDEGDEGETEETVYEIDGEEVKAEELKTWRESYEREQGGTAEQEDYKLATKEAADKSQKLDEYLAAFESGESEIESMLLSDLESEDELNELKTSDYTEYLQAKERREEKLNSFKAVKQKIMQAKQAKLSQESEAIAEVRGWSTEAKRDGDLKLLNEFAKTNGFTDDDMRTLTSAKVLNALISAAEQAKKASVGGKGRKKVIKPTVLKASGKGDKKPEPQSLADRLFNN